MLEGKNVNLRVMEKEDLPQITEWFNNTEFLGEYMGPFEARRAEMEKFLESALFETKGFFIEKKDGSKIGYTRARNKDVKSIRIPMLEKWTL